MCFYLLHRYRCDCLPPHTFQLMSLGGHDCFMFFDDFYDHVSMFVSFGSLLWRAVVTVVSVGTCIILIVEVPTRLRAMKWPPACVRWSVYS